MANTTTEPASDLLLGGPIHGARAVTWIRTVVHGGPRTVDGLVREPRAEEIKTGAPTAYLRLSAADAAHMGLLTVDTHGACDVEIKCDDTFWRPVRLEYRIDLPDQAPAEFVVSTKVGRRMLTPGTGNWTLRLRLAQTP